MDNKTSKTTFLTKKPPAFEDYPTCNDNGNVDDPVQ